MVEEIKFCNDIMKKYFNKELGMTKEEDEDFENSSKSWICDNVYAEGVFKVRYHCHITGKSKWSAHGDSNISIKFLLYSTT